MILDLMFCFIGSMEEAKKNMYAFSTTTYTGFQCTVDEETSEKFKGKSSIDYKPTTNFSKHFGWPWLILLLRFL